MNPENNLAATPAPGRNAGNGLLFTASQIAIALGKTSQAVRKRLRGVPATGSLVVSGNTTEGWHIGALPPQTQTELRDAAMRRGYSSVAEMFNACPDAWTPTLPLDEMSQDELNKAHQLREALLPSLSSPNPGSAQEFEKAGVEDYRKVFGRPITRRYFRYLINRTVERDSGLNQFDRIVLYVSERPARKPSQAKQFPNLQTAFEQNLDEAELWKAVFVEYDLLVKCGMPGKQVGRQLRNYIFLKRLLPLSREALERAFARRLNRWLAYEGRPDALRDARRDNSRESSDIAQQIETLGWFVPAARFFYLLTNRRKDSGSLPEAIRRTICLPEVPTGWPAGMKKKLVESINRDRSCLGGIGEELPSCPEELRERILLREREGKAIVPEGIARSITSKVTPQMIEMHRRPHEAELKYLSAPGTGMMVRRKTEDGNRSVEYEFAKAGSILEADDGSINFPVCVPWAMGGNLCADKFGVIVGRFQWLRTIDVGTRYRPGWAFVARPRGSFRGTDVLTLLHGIALQHGIWEQYRLEQGVFKSHLVTDAIRQMGAYLHTVFSAHSKPFIEGGFNQDWTKLSVQFPHCDLGRYRGDTEETNRILQACRAGQQDPRRIFPPLRDVMAAFEQITAEENRTLVKSKNWGQWVPEDRWNEQKANLRKYEEGTAFIFAPYAPTWTVHGAVVGGRVPIFEGMPSIPFDFSSPQLPQWDGAKVRVHFDPSAKTCSATAVLGEKWKDYEAGHVIGPVEQVNETAGYVRMVLGWGNDDRAAGIRAKQQAAGAMRRELQTIMPGGRAGYSKSEEHDGINKVSIVQRDTRPGVEQSKERLRKNLSGQDWSNPDRDLRPTETRGSNSEREISQQPANLNVTEELRRREREFQEDPLEFM